MSIEKKSRVVLGMSGGVDSSAAAAILLERGYDVVGVTIKTYNYDDVGGNALNESSCCSIDGINDARVVCNTLGIPHYVMDFSPEFRDNVINMFVDEYLQGNTPNPCVICNRKIKWEQLISRGLALGADFVAMGHYASLSHSKESGRFWISRGEDSSKDQSYALWAVSQESLARTIFPLSGMTKDEIRAKAQQAGLHVASKHDSFEICFIPDNDYTRFLRDVKPDLDAKVRGGDVIFKGEKIGEHDGYPFYTIGQRRGLNVAVGEPVFVTDINAKTNTIIVGSKNDLLHKSFVATRINMQKYSFPEGPMQVLAKIRHRDPGAVATIEPFGEDEMRVTFDEPRQAITKGQSTVWYEGDDVVGGGIISKILD